MKIFGLKVFEKETGTDVVVKNTVVGGSTIWNSIRESFAGAWQKNVTIDSPTTMLSFSAVFACVTGIAADIGKLPIRILIKSGAVWIDDTDSNTIGTLLKKPNHYQNRIKFLEQWIISKLLHGNTYVLKRRGAQGAVVALYILDPRRVKALITPSGDVYYELQTDDLSRLGLQSITVPASEMIHDTMVALWHPLCGVSPIYACGVAATLGNRIANNSANFFANASRPSGMLTAPGEISDTTASRLKVDWETNFSGVNIGRLAVLGDGLKYEAMTIPAADAQLIEQLRWTVEDVARAFHYPLYKLGGPLPTYNNIEALNQTYYSDCLQSLIESLELCIDEGVALGSKEKIELDLDNLLRMDSASRYERHNKAIAGGWLSPNEARVIENHAPVAGGDSPMMQQQNYSLAALQKRDQKSAEDNADIQATAMNGAQVTALQGLLVAVADGSMPPETARAAISAAFPLLTGAEVAAMIDPIQPASITPPTAPTPAADGNTEDDTEDGDVEAEKQLATMMDLFAAEFSQTKDWSAANV